MKCKIIGGEFTVDLQNHHEAKEKNVTHDGIYKYSTGRSALYYILLDLKNTRGIHKILLPDYLCSSVVIAAEKAKVDVVFYPLNEILELDESFFAKLYDETYAVLLINYYGLKDISNQVDYIRLRRRLYRHLPHPRRLRHLPLHLQKCPQRQEHAGQCHRLPPRL